MVRRPLAVAACALLALVSGACRVDVHVGVTVEDDGSGVVRVDVALDPEAAGRVPRLADQLVLTDLVDAGWRVRGPEREDDGNTWIRLSKPFVSPEGAGVVLEELTGPEGAFGGLALERRRSTIAETWHFEGAVDLRDRLGAFSDPALQARLEGTDVGVTEAELERVTGAPLEEALRFELTVDLPGSVSTNGAARSGGGSTWTPDFGSLERVSATGRVLDEPRLALLSVSLTATVTLVLVLCTRLVRRRRPGTVR
ncbi:MAG: hypothetical protein M3R01_07625 [Actinomycetota bacterium]|nr:hypothetical protein [Acidimicrobiia bacterium]MDQ3146792.1 hypothetical protein [Actinomycetota bacterium]